MNDYDSILNRLKAGIGNKITTIEGSFCGDILCSVANELAKFYAVDIETVYEKAFVCSAKGQWLDNAAGNWGIERIEGESDEMMRERVLSKLKNQASSGNIEDYKTWAKSVEGVRAAQIVPKSGGNVFVYIMADDGQAQSVMERTKALIESKRPIGATVTVAFGASRAIAISASIRIAKGESIELATADIKMQTEKYFKELSLYCEAVHISHSKLMGIMLNVKNVQDVSNLCIEGKAQSLTLSEGEYPSLGTLTLTRS